MGEGGGGKSANKESQTPDCLIQENQFRRIQVPQNSCLLLIRCAIFMLQKDLNYTRTCVVWPNAILNVLHKTFGQYELKG